jgi:CHAT domain-containing protein/Tfp pilus assembly protein PilF
LYISSVQIIVLQNTLKLLISVLFCSWLAGSAPSCLAQAWEGLLSEADSAMAKVHYEHAQNLLMQALSLTEAANGPDDQSVATILNTLGKCYIFRGMYTEAESVVSRALDIRERKYSTAELEIGKCVNNLAIVFKNTGRIPQAETLYRRAIEIRERMLGPDHPELAVSLNNLANLLISAARYAEVEPLYQRALEIMEKAHGEDHPDVAKAFNNLAVLYHVEGRYRDAEPLYQRALEINRKIYGDDHPDVAQSLNNLAYLYHDQREYSKAEPLYRQALDMGVRVQGSNHPKVASTLSNLARLYTDEDRYAEAEPLARRAIEIGEQSMKDNLEVAEFRDRLGDILQLQGRFDEAQAAYEEALATVEKVAGKEHPKAALVLHGMAALAQRRNHLDQAIELQKRAYLVRRKNFSDGFGVLSERSSLDYSQFLQTEASNYLSLLLAAPDGDNTYREEIAKVVFSTKGLVTDGSFVRSRFYSTMAMLNDSLTEARNVLSKLYVEGADPARPWALQTDIARAAQRKEKFEADLARSGTEFRSEKIITQVDPQQVAAHLTPGTGLVEFMRYERSTGLNSREPRFLAVVVKSNGRTFACDLGSEAEIDSAVGRYRRHMADVQSLGMDDYRSISSELFRLVWQPFEMQVTGLGAVLISPDDALNLISFAAIRAPDGQYLIERHPIHYLSSGRDLVREIASVTRGKGLLAFGDPDYDATVASRAGRAVSGSVASAIATLVPGLHRSGTSGCRALRDMQVGRLPATRAEVDGVVRQWNSTTPEPVQEFFGAQATEDAFKKYSHGARVVHLATHGYYISSACNPEKSSSGYVGESPLLQSGLFFAGANLKGTGAAEAGMQDGILTAEEVAGMNLGGTELVVLSACETGLGEVKSGEGVFGLRRAFQMAGARTVISALWPVDDKSTAELMGNLFPSHDANLYDAMRNSALHTIQARRAAGESDHPFYWGAFIATGDWKN